MIEYFCSMCVAVPVTIVTGTGIVGFLTKEEYNHRKAILLIFSVLGLLFSILSFWY